MLKHLPACPHLSKGQYWCFHCQKPERVGKLDCKRCQGLPSKTDRMASVAKKIFSKLGARANRHEHSAPSTEHGKSFGLWNNGESSSSGLHQQPKFSDDKSMSYWNDSDIPELPNTSICPEMPADMASHELDSNYICEMTGTELPFEMAIGDESCWVEDNFYTESLEDWDVDAQSNVQHMPPPPTPRKSPKLARLDTSFTSLNTSMTINYGIPQRHNSAHFPETPISPTIISPLSATAMFSAGTFEVSPTDSETSGSSFFTDSGYSSATTTMSAWNCQAILDQVADSEHQRGKKRARDDEPDFGDWIHESIDPAQKSMLQPPAKVVATELSQRLEDISSHDFVGCPSSEEPILISSHWCDRATFVHAFSDALDAHIDHTRAALKNFPGNSITRELSAMSKTSMVSIGLEALAGILEGRKPTAIIQVFAFTHISCAFVIATEHDDGASIITKTWFKDMLTWVDNLGAAPQHQSYAQMARSIWRPCEVPEAGIQMDLFSPTQRHNSLLTGCKHFLDSTFPCRQKLSSANTMKYSNILEIVTVSKRPENFRTSLDQTLLQELNFKCYMS